MKYLDRILGYNIWFDSDHPDVEKCYDTLIEDPELCEIKARCKCCKIELIELFSCQSHMGCPECNINYGSIHTGTRIRFEYENRLGYSKKDTKKLNRYWRRRLLKKAII